MRLLQSVCFWGWQCIKELVTLLESGDYEMVNVFSGKYISLFGKVFPLLHNTNLELTLFIRSRNIH